MEDEIIYEDVKYQKFNESLDINGEIDIAGYQFYPSFILFKIDKDLFVEAYFEFKEREFEELKDVIYNQYPSCIAYNFRLSEKGEGASDPVRKLLHLKDTRESIVFILYAIVWGEIRFKNIDLKPAQVLVSVSPTGPVYRNFNTDRLITDALKTKIQNIKAIIQYSQNNGLGLKCEEIELDLLDKLLGLQDIRNDISHHNAPTKEEAEAELLQVNPLFIEMLTMTEFLAECKILRFESFASKCRCEEFNGHYLNKEYDNFDFGTKQAYVLGLGQEQLFLKWDDEIFSISPFIHYHNIVGSRESYLSLFKFKREGRFWFEPVTRREEISFDHLQARFDAEQRHLQNLIIP